MLKLAINPDVSKGLYFDVCPQENQHRLTAWHEVHFLDFKDSIAHGRVGPR
jgi:hypothetical protein